MNDCNIDRFIAPKGFKFVKASNMFVVKTFDLVKFGEND
jgi:hypothetical protein